MQFTPKSHSEIEQARKERAEKMLLPKGEYDFEVIGAEAKTSSKGNEMIAVNLKVYGADGRPNFVNDYLMEKMEEKFYNFAQATGLGEKYAQGELEPYDCEGRSGRVKIKVETSEDYGSKNVVQNYVAPKTVRPSTPLEEPSEDDIPF